jgi:glycosyltransferase involved in cell wall biosynthesis
MVDSLGYQGVEAVVMNYYRHIDRSHIQFDFIITSSKPQKYIEEVLHLGGLVYKLPSRNRHPIRYISQLRKIFKENTYNIFHAHGNSASIAIDTLVAKICGIKIIIGHSHNTKCLYPFQHHLLKPLLRFTLTHRFAGSEETAKWLFGKSNYMLFINGIDLEHYKFSTPLRNQYRAQYKLNDALVYLHVGAYRESKNHIFIIDIFNQIYNKNTNSYLLLVGDGELKEKINQKISGLDCSSNIIQVGNIADTSPYYSMADCFLFPSIYEGISVAIIEAQANSLTVFASDSIPSDSILVDFVYQLSLEFNADQWANKILEVVPTFRKELIDNKNLESFDITTLSLKLEKFYYRSIYGEKYNDI